MAEFGKDVEKPGDKAVASVRERGEVLVKATDTLRKYQDEIRRAIAPFLYPEEAAAIEKDGDFFGALGRLETGKQFLTPAVQELIEANAFLVRTARPSRGEAKPASAQREREASGSAGAELKKLMRPEGATLAEPTKPTAEARPEKKVIAPPKPAASTKPAAPPVPPRIPKPQRQPARPKRTAAVPKSAPAVSPKSAPAATPEPVAAASPKSAPAAIPESAPASAPASAQGLESFPPELADKLSRLRGHLLSGYFSPAKLIYNACSETDRKFFDSMVLEVTRHYLSNLHITTSIVKKTAIVRIMQLIADYGRSLANPQGIPISEFRAALDSVKEKLPKRSADAVEVVARKSLQVLFRAEGIRSLAPAASADKSGDDGDDDDEQPAPPADPDEEISAVSRTVKDFLLEGKYERAIRQTGDNEEALTKAVLETFVEDLKNLGADFESDNTNLNTARDLFEFFEGRIGAQSFVIMVAAARTRLVNKFGQERGDQLFNLIKIKFPELFPSQA